MPVPLDKLSSLYNVMAVGLAQSLYYYARYNGEIIPWIRVKRHDLGHFCHCNVCGPRCKICVADRIHPAHHYDQHGSYVHNPERRTDRRTPPAPGYHNPGPDFDDPQDSGREYS